MKRIRIIGVAGSGVDAHAELARPLGRLIAEMGCHLLTGGGGGVMAEVARGFCDTPQRRGLSVGVIRGETTPCAERGDEGLCHRPARVNEWVELPIHTHLPHSGARGREMLRRNHLNVLSADALIALPGGPGTCAEVTLRIDYGRAVILWLGNGTIDGRAAEYFETRAPHDGQVKVARLLSDIPGCIEDCIGFTPWRRRAAVPGPGGAASVFDPLAKRFDWPRMAGERVLVIGIGGGGDILCAYALADVIRSGCGARSVVYANAKPCLRENLEPVSPHIFRLPASVRPLPAGAHVTGSTLIDQSVPRGEDGCPLICVVPEAGEEGPALAREIAGLGFDRIIAVDTGGDSIAPGSAGAPCRDKVMLGILRESGVPVLHLVVGPGADGETDALTLARAVERQQAAGRYLGAFSIDPILKGMWDLIHPLPPDRAQHILLSAYEGRLPAGAEPDRVAVPRGVRPQIPRRWLASVLAFEG